MRHFSQFCHNIKKIPVLFYVTLLKIQFVWNSLNTFAFILPQQRPVLVSVHAQNFVSWSLARKKYSRELPIVQPQRQFQGWLRLQIKYIYHIYNFVKRLQCYFKCILGVKVAKNLGKITKKWPTSGHKQHIFYKILFKNW